MENQLRDWLNMSESDTHIVIGSRYTTEKVNWHLKPDSSIMSSPPFPPLLLRAKIEINVGMLHDLENCWQDNDLLDQLNIPVSTLQCGIASKCVFRHIIWAKELANFADASNVE